MTRNMGQLDRILRGVFGIALLAWAVLGTQSLHWIGWIGIVPLVTAAVGVCPLYKLVGMNTCGART